MGKKKKKAAKPSVPKPVEERAGKPTKDDKRLPKGKVTPAQIDTLVTTIRGMGRKVTVLQRQQEDENQRRRKWEQKEERRWKSAPNAPWPGEAAFASLVEKVGELLERVGGIESRLQQPPRDPSLDVPASVVEKRVFFAGACKTLNLIRPTPAIVGRAMHAEKATSRTAAKSPYEVFNAIYTAVKIAMGFQSSRSEESPDVARDFIHLDAEMVAMMEERSARPKKKHTTYYDAQLSPRLKLLENMRLACVETNRSGRRVDYSRYLMPEGQSLFNGWPDWTDATGGIGLVDEDRTPAPPPPNEPANAAPSPDAGADATPPLT
jgi:hypothetical protein